MVVEARELGPSGCEAAELKGLYAGGHFRVGGGTDPKCIALDIGSALVVRGMVRALWVTPDHLTSRQSQRWDWACDLERRFSAPPSHVLCENGWCRTQRGSSLTLGKKPRVYGRQNHLLRILSS